MVRIGAVNIDTSHPLGFGEILANGERGRYVGVYNDSFRSDTEVEGFIQKFGLEKRCATLEELAAMCDIGFIHGCNWEDHLRCARPFLAVGKPVFIDKPIAGNLRDCLELEKLAAGGAVILGASSVRYAGEVIRLAETPVSERGEIINVSGTSGVDEFNYGIHIVEAIGAVAGTGAQSVRFMGRGEQGVQHCDSYFVRYENGITAEYHTFTGVWQPFTLTAMTTKTTVSFTIDSGRLYAALLGEILNFMEGAPSRLAPVPVLTEAVRIMLAGRISRETGGGEVLLSSLPESDSGFNGMEFYRSYAAAASDIYQ